MLYVERSSKPTKPSYAVQGVKRPKGDTEVGGGGWRLQQFWSTEVICWSEVDKRGLGVSTHQMPCQMLSFFMRTGSAARNATLHFNLLSPNSLAQCFA